MTGNETLNKIFILWRNRIAHMVSRIVPPQDIEDIVQETYVRACQYNSQRKIQSPSAFMIRTARNIAIDHIKSAESRYTCTIGENIEFYTDETRRFVDDPYYQLVSREEFSLFCEAVRSLPLQCRRVFVLKKVYGHSQHEIAHELNLSESTIEKHIAQGIKRCILYMRQHSEENDNSISTHTYPIRREEYF